MHRAYSILIDLQPVADKRGLGLACNSAVNQKRAETVTKQRAIVNFNANSSIAEGLRPDLSLIDDEAVRALICTYLDGGESTSRKGLYYHSPFLIESYRTPADIEAGHSPFDIYIFLSLSQATDFQPKPNLSPVSTTSGGPTSHSLPGGHLLTLLHTRMCVTLTKCFRMCAARPCHTFQQELMCAAGGALNPPTWCPYDPNCAPAHYPPANRAMKTATTIDCPYCTNMRVVY